MSPACGEWRARGAAFTANGSVASCRVRSAVEATDPWYRPARHRRRIDISSVAVPKHRSTEVPRCRHGAISAMTSAAAA
ncbi:hypothetical protein BURPSS13_P0966 [Burkholderia pseudomallei S13]|nr:hypothetical protein BURPSS13_P0966 [Burkholderia pseudomallei S13]